jgi:hypothetical protein
MARGALQWAHKLQFRVKVALLGQVSAKPQGSRGSAKKRATALTAKGGNLFPGGCKATSEMLALCGPAAEAPQPPVDQVVAAESGWSDDGREPDADQLASEAEDRFVGSQLGEFLLVWSVAVFLVSTR